MSLRINHNTAAINAHRNLVKNNQDLTKSLEQLSSGYKINRAADAPASLIISEQLRAQISSINQAVDNSETAISMIQTAEAAMVEVTNIIVSMRRLAMHAANEGVNDEGMIYVDQVELDNSLEAVDRLAKHAGFGKKKLLDGSTGANGIGVGDGLQFVEASPQTASSPIEGYAVVVSQLATRSELTGTVSLNKDIIDKGETMTISEGGKTLTYTTEAGDSPLATVGKLRQEVEGSGLNVDIIQNDDDTITVRHKEYGSEYNFSVSSTTAGLLSSEAQTIQPGIQGKDVVGTLGGEIAVGKGRILTGADGSPVQGLQVRYSGDVTTSMSLETPLAEIPEDQIAGTVGVYQNSLAFQVGPNAEDNVRASLVNVNTNVLGRGIENKSDFNSLRDINITDLQGAIDAQRIIDKAIDEVTITRGVLGAFQKNTLEPNLRQMRINLEELGTAESVIRDTDMAYAITQFTRNSIMSQAATAMLAQANQIPQTVLSLLG